MKNTWMALIIVILSLFSITAFAQQSGGSGGDDLKETCELSGGTWTGSAGGNWACCWSDWGCYGCVDGHCKIKCNTARCRKANGQASSSPTSNPKVQIVKGLAPAGMKAPVAPTPKKKDAVAAPESVNSVQ